jgi:hypothetical protein
MPFCRRHLPTLALPMFLLALFLGTGFAPPATAATAEYVIQISVDGLGSCYLKPLVAAGELPNFKRFQTEGSWTDNARNDSEVTVTLPNHTAMITSRHVLGPQGHRWTKNTDPPKGMTLEKNNGQYLAGVFDVAHDHGLRTALFAGKTKFSLYAVSYNADNGAVCASSPDHGRNKIDCFVVEKDSKKLIDRFVEEMSKRPFQYSFVHFADPDSAGHPFGWGSDAYKQAIRNVDGQLGRLFKLVETDARFCGKTTILLTSDHGGKDHNHVIPTLPEVYTIPFYAWGCGVAAGKDLYAVNAAARHDPDTGHPLRDDAAQPIRNGEVGNLGLSLLGLGPIPGSTLNPRQDLRIGVAPVAATPGAN